MSEYKIRPHHALCINFFEGKGYSPEFTANMTAVIKVLESENPVVEITTGHDVICRCCPCTDCHGKALSYDLKVLDICGISGNILWKDLKKIIYKKIISAGKLLEICGNCQWFSICGKKGT